MPDKSAKADVARIRQTTQFTCCAASIASALHALGKPFSEADVNKVLGAAPMAGATWEAMLATVQYFGCRGTLVVPATPRMLKEWTDQGIPVVIAWNPEGRPWSHASTVFDVQEGEDGKLTVYVMDSNIPNPDETVRVLDADTFCQKWGEKVSDSLIVRRPAMAVTLEVSPAGRQVVASRRAAEFDWRRLGREVREALARTRVPPKAVTGQVYKGGLVGIDVHFGYDYFEKPGWDESLVETVVAGVAHRHGLRGEYGDYVAPDGQKVRIDYMAEAGGGSPERLASMKKADDWDDAFNVTPEGPYPTLSPLEQRALLNAARRTDAEQRAARKAVGAPPNAPVEWREYATNRPGEWAVVGTPWAAPEWKGRVKKTRKRRYGLEAEGTDMKITESMVRRVADAHEAKSDPNKVVIKKEDLPKRRLGPEMVTTTRPGGPMQTRTDDVDKGRSRKPKHKKPWGDE
jgi:hypothetical protein